VVGPVGAGKVSASVLNVLIVHHILLWSSMLQCLLGELEALDGSVDIHGSVSYVSQEPWIFFGTIKENILCGEVYDKAWFNRVVECCSLVKVMRKMTILVDDVVLIGY